MNQVRQLLARASDQQREAFINLDALKTSIDAALQAAKQARRDGPHRMPYPIRRKHLLTQVSLKSRYYGLCEEIQAFVYAAGFHVLQELDNDQLAALLDWLTLQAERADAGCDSDLAPPAR
ncbi:hypothetical protein OS176_07835 [Xanthomonadaceae bacterium XH05]|nr:hypothetical protein [Xanthomonadaceae bacterium XH05]